MPLPLSFRPDPTCVAMRRLVRATRIALIKSSITHNVAKQKAIRPRPEPNPRTNYPVTGTRIVLRSRLDDLDPITTVELIRFCRPIFL